MNKKDLKKTLQQSWYRATEEETDTEKVYRPVPVGGQVPRGRLRELFTLNEDGTLIEGGIAPTDARIETEGNWKLEEDDQLVFYTQSAPEPTRVMKIASVDKDRLVVKK